MERGLVVHKEGECPDKTAKWEHRSDGHKECGEKWRQGTMKGPEEEAIWASRTRLRFQGWDIQFSPVLLQEAFQKCLPPTCRRKWLPVTFHG